MKTRIFKSIMVGAIVLGGCSESNHDSSESETEDIVYTPILEQVDDLNARLAAATAAASTDLIVSLDHHRMANEYGVYTPPAQAMLFSDSEINSKILSSSNQLVGLDLPFKTLCYSEPDTVDAKLAYTSALFIGQRHGLDPSVLLDYNAKLLGIIGSFDRNEISETNLKTVDEGFGIVKIQSAFDFKQTIEKLKFIVNAQDDTRWFGEIDYQNDATKYDIELRPTTLLLFGGPAPGGQAMVNTPKIGLDAFCQKLLVYEDEDGTVWVAYNDIVLFSYLYYSTSTKPQEMINMRLKQTFTKAVSASME